MDAGTRGRLFMGFAANVAAEFTLQIIVRVSGAPLHIELAKAGGYIEISYYNEDMFVL
jgi:hypothetical protein